MFVLVTYDIEDDRLRGRVAKVMEGYGRRVQYSVFECQLPNRRYDELKERLTHEVAHVPDDQTCSIRFYPMCRACVARFEAARDETIALDDDFYIV